ncbi:MAG: L,D-transpeptidase [Nanoarchaeota archaeon]|nr:L,D-transpeptidase [Nanoarchaeota archaeon]
MSSKKLYFIIPILFSFSHANAEESKKHILVDLKNFKFFAYDEEGELIREGLASGGRRFCPDIKRKCKTPSGSFRVLAKKGKFYKSPLYPLNCGNPKEGKVPCAPMPYSIKFLASGESIHGSPNDNWNNPKQISHGCIHATNEDAKWINEWVNIGDKVKILKY